MDDWKKQLAEYTVYCKEDRKDAWINDIETLDITKFPNVPEEYESHKKSFIKTAEIMKALDEGESWKQIGKRLMEEKEYCQYPVGIIGHMMLKYSKHGVEFIKVVIGDSIELMTDLQEEYNEELEKSSKII